MLVVRYTAYNFDAPRAISREEYQALRANPGSLDDLLGGSLGARVLAMLAHHRLAIGVTLVELGLTLVAYLFRGPGRTWVMILFFGLALLSIGSLLALGATFLSFLKYALSRAWYRRRLGGVLASATTFEAFTSSARQSGLLPPVLVGGLR